MMMTNIGVKGKKYALQDTIDKQELINCLLRELGVVNTRTKNRLTLSFMDEIEGDSEMGAKPIQSKASKERPSIIDAVNDESEQQKLIVEKLPENQSVSVADIEP
jgi:hypothetical protein